MTPEILDIIIVGIWCSLFIAMSIALYPIMPKIKIRKIRMRTSFKKNVYSKRTLERLK